MSTTKGPRGLSPSAGVIGLGVIGSGLASSLMDRGVALSVYNVRAEATVPLARG